MLTAAIICTGAALKTLGVGGLATAIIVIGIIRAVFSLLELIVKVAKTSSLRETRKSFQLEFFSYIGQ